MQMLSSGSGLLVAIDTSTDTAGLGLADGERLTELVWPAGRTQTTSVLAELDAMLARSGRTVADIGAIAVAIGPGTFTGLRVGLSIAKGLMLAQDVALIGVPTLQVAATPFLEAGQDVLTVLPAGRGRVVCARFDIGSDDGDREAPHNLAFAEFVERAVGLGRLVVGELTGEQRAALLGRGVRLASAGASIRRPSVLASIGVARWQAGALDDAATLEPLYVHGAPATTKPVVDTLRRS